MRLSNEKKVWGYCPQKREFLIEIVRWNRPLLKFLNQEGIVADQIEYIWNIYIYIYDKHPLFSTLKSPDWNEFPIEMHGGVTYSQWYYDKDVHCYCKQYGCDYMHLGDDSYKETKDIDNVAAIYCDAKIIYRELLSHLPEKEEKEAEKEKTLPEEIEK